LGDCETEYLQFLATFPAKANSADRREIFCSNLARVEEHGQANAMWTMGINEFSDWTEDEKAAMLGWDLNDGNSQLPPFKPSAALELAEGVDWRTRMTPVKQQGSCGSCWAFSAIDVVDFMVGGSHSEQQVLDCSGAGSCQGGNAGRALQYLTRAGSASESAYPYAERDGSCHSFQPMARVSNVQSVSGASNIAAALQRQVVSLCFRLSRNSPWSHYQSGIYNTPCGQGEGHCVAAVGYASNYWIIRNSWGSGWGQGGHIYFQRGSNLCEMESAGTIADATAVGPSPTPPSPPSPPTPPSPPFPSCPATLPVCMCVGCGSRPHSCSCPWGCYYGGCTCCGNQNAGNASFASMMGGHDGDGNNGASQPVVV